MSGTPIYALKPAGWFNRAAFWFLRLSVGNLVRWYFKFEVENPPQLRGAYIVVSNHVSVLDPLLIGSAGGARMTFVMTLVHYRSASLGWFYRLVRAIPLDIRGGNREPLRAAKAVLDRGEVLSIFPEGGISRDGQLLLGNPGAVALVLSEGVPVVPAALVGAHEAMQPGSSFPRRHKVIFRCGEPLMPEDLAAAGEVGRKARLRAATERIMRAIGELSDQPSREDWLAEIR